MFLQPPLISYVWNAARDTKLQYLLGLRKFKATGQSLGNLKPALQVRHYLMYTVCPIAGSYRDLVFDMKLFLVRQTSARGHERSGHLFLVACVAGAKRGGGGGREKGKREGSACSKSLCFCITPTNFLVIRLRLLSIKCRYTRHCRKTLHSRTKEIRLVIQIQKAL